MKNKHLYFRKLGANYCFVRKKLLKNKVNFFPQFQSNYLFLRHKSKIVNHKSKINK